MEQNQNNDGQKRNPTEQGEEADQPLLGEVINATKLYYIRLGVSSSGKNEKIKEFDIHKETEKLLFYDNGQIKKDKLGKIDTNLMTNIYRTFNYYAHTTNKNNIDILRHKILKVIRDRVNEIDAVVSEIKTHL